MAQGTHVDKVFFSYTLLSIVSILHDFELAFYKSYTGFIHFLNRHAKQQSLKIGRNHIQDNSNSLCQL